MPTPTPPTAPLAPPFQGYLLDEDLALKTKLSGIVVHDVNSSQRPVGVWYRTPEPAERQRTYPYISISFTGEEIAHDREHRGWVPFYHQYLQDNPLPSPVNGDWSIPMTLSYEVTTNCRSNNHHSQLVGVLSQIGYLHPRFGTLLCPGNTVRRLERISAVPANGLDSEGKRIFRMVYQLRVPTEIENTMVVSTTRVSSVVIQFLNP